MKTYTLTVALAIGMLCATREAAHAAAGIRSTSAGLLTTRAPAVLDASVVVDAGKRELVSGNTTHRVDLLRIVPRVGIDVAPWLSLHAGIGWAQADVDLRDDEGGLAWNVGARLALIEQTLIDSPVTGPVQAWGLAVECDYAYTESSAGAVGSDWFELTVTPLLHYTVGRRSESIPDGRRVPGSALTLGLQFSDIDGDLEAVPVHGRRDFAPVIGGEVLLGNDWAVSLRTVIFGTHDTVYRFAVGRYF